MPTRSSTALPADPLGPGAAAWYAAADLRAALLSVRTLVLQVAHPMVGAGVGEHSVYKDDPYGRLWRTIASLVRQVFGGVAAAEEGRRLIELHRDIRGVDRLGRRYHALDPDAYLWVHATMFDNWRIFLRAYGPGLTAAQEQQLFDEWRRVGLLIGVRPRVLPETLADFEAYWAAMLPVLEDNPVVQDLLYEGPRRPPYVPIPAAVMRGLTAPLLRYQRSFLAETLPPELVSRFGLERSAQTARHLRALTGVARILGRVPRPLRFTITAQIAMARTRRDRRVAPEPVAYP